MNRSQRTIAGLLTAVVVLLAADILTRATATATAQPQMHRALVGVTASSGRFVWRAWSNGDIEVYDDPIIGGTQVWPGWRRLPAN